MNSYIRIVSLPLLVVLLGCTKDEDILPEESNFDPNHIVQVAIEMDSGDWDELRNQSRSFFSEFLGDCRQEPFQHPYTTFSASITIDGESLPNIGIRKKGFIGSQSVEKPGLKINLDEFEEGAELFGTDNVTLNNSVQDPSLIRQCLSYSRYAAAGLPSPLCNFARVSMNGADLGIYVHVEPVKRSMLRRNFGNDDGDLYEGTLSDFQTKWLPTFEAKTDDTDPSLSRIKSLTDALANGPKGIEAIQPHLDIEQTLSFLALENITGQWDGYAANQNNFYVYLDPSLDRFVFLPWGADGTLHPDAIEMPPFNASALAKHILEDEELASRLQDRIEQLFETIWVEEELLAEVDRMEELLGTEIDMTPYQEGIDGVRKYIERRRDALIPQLPGSPPDELEGGACLTETGQIETQFETTWESMGTEELFETGTADVTVTWEGDNIPFIQTGALAGYNEEGVPMVVLGALISAESGAMLIPYTYFDPEQVEPGVPLSVDWRGGDSGGAILYTDNNMGGQLIQAGFMSNGELRFDIFERTTGGTVKGELQSSLYAWETW